MSLNQFKNDALQFLFENYKNESATSIYSINDIASKYGLDPNDAGKYLLNGGTIKNQQFRPDGFLCSISWAGINFIAPEYVESNLSKLISTLRAIRWTTKYNGNVRFRTKRLSASV